MNKKKIKIAIVGCGRISKSHFESIEKYQDQIDLISVCDINQKTLSEHKSKYKVNGYLELKDMLKNENLNLVVICTPSGIHAEQTILCAKNGIHVMTEKPMAVSFEDGKSMIKACENSGVKLFVVKQNRKNPTLQLLKKAITEKRFGKIHMVHLNVFWNRSQEYYDQADWRGTLRLDGGAFMNQASHYVDLLQWLVGPIHKVHSMMSTTRNIEAEDTGVMNIQWQNGTLGSMSVTMLSYLKNFEGSITVLGEKGTVRIGGVAVNDIQHWEFDEPKDYDNKIEKISYKTSSIYGNGHQPYYQNVIDVLLGRAAPETDGREGLKSLEIITAAYLSARDGKEIILPIDN